MTHADFDVVTGPSMEQRRALPPKQSGSIPQRAALPLTPVPRSPPDAETGGEEEIEAV